MTEVHAEPVLEREIAKSMGPDAHALHVESSTHLREVLRAAATEMNGQPAEVVHGRLVTELCQAAPAVRVGDAKMWELARAISAGTLIC